MRTSTHCQHGEPLVSLINGIEIETCHCCGIKVETKKLFCENCCYAPL